MSSPSHALALDIGGTKMAAAVVDREGVLTGLTTVPTPVDNGEALFETLAALVAQIGRAHV